MDLFGRALPHKWIGPEPNFARYPDATQYVLTNWPGKTTFTGDELGQIYKAGGKLTNTFALSSNPVAMAWHHFNGGSAKESRDSAAVLYAVRGIASHNNSYFKKAATASTSTKRLTASPTRGSWPWRKTPGLLTIPSRTPI